MIKQIKEYRLNCKRMGSAFELVVVHENEQAAKALLQKGDDEIIRLEAMLSEFKADSVVTLINKNAGIKAIKVNDEVFGLLQRCLQISDISNGAFDISVGPLKQLYSFKKKVVKFPSKQRIKEALKKVGQQNILLSRKKKTVFLKREGMQISLAAIGKGYAADCVKKIWLKSGLSAGIINASGDLTTFGKRSDGSDWKIGIPSPKNKNEMLFFIPVQDASVATSGDAEQFFMHKNKRYSHNVNPKTGFPVEGLSSISVFSPSAELSDALATAVYVKGVKQGLEFINQLPATHCIIIDNNDKVFFSKNLSLQDEK